MFSSNNQDKYTLTYPRRGLIAAILAVVVLSLIVIAIILPWLTVSILGQFSFSLLDIFRGSYAPDDNSPGRPDVTQLASTYPDTNVALAMTLITYVIALFFSIVALASPKLRMRALGSSGFSALSSAVLWIYMIESLKSHAISESGGLGQMFGGVLSAAVNIGVGTYLVLIAGILGLATYFLRESLTKKSLAKNP